MQNRSIFTIVIFISSLTLRTVITLASETTIFPANGRISGFIVDKNKDQPIPDANIIIHRTRFGTASQDGGYYFIDNIPQGNYDITVRVIGYRTETKKEFHIGRDTTLNFALVPTHIQMDPIIVTATRSDHLQSKVTVSSEVLTLPRIKEQNGDATGEVIESVGGLLIKDQGGFAGLKTISIRGSNDNQVLVLLDGQKLNSAQDGTMDINTLPVEILERIEIIRGGHSALLGSAANGGVIHLITKDSQPPKGYVYSVHSTIGSFGTQNNRFYGSHQFGPLQLFFNYNHLQSDGDFKYQHSDSTEKKIRKNNDFRGDNVFLKAKFNLNSKNLLRFIHQSLQTDRGTPGSLYIASPRARREENRKLYTLQSENQVTNRLRMKEQLYYQTYNNLYINPDYSVKDRYENTFVGSDLQAIWTVNSHLVLNFGAELRQDRLETNKYSKQKRNTQSIFFQTEIDHSLNLFGMRTYWKWIPALRRDNYTDVESHTCPKLGLLISSGNETNIVFRGNIGKSFRVPTFNDLYWPEGQWTKGNPDLSPEISTNFDIGLLVQRNKPSTFQVELTYFQSNFKDLIIWVSGSDWVYSPINMDAHITGFENNWTFRLPNNQFYIRFAYTWMNAIDETPNSPNRGNRLIYRPDNKFDVNTGFTIRSFKLNLNYRYIGKRYTVLDNLKSLNDYELLNGNIWYSLSFIGLNIDARFQVQNLLNKSIYILEGYPIPGREFRVTLGCTY